MSSSEDRAVRYVIARQAKAGKKVTEERARKIVERRTREDRMGGSFGYDFAGDGAGKKDADRKKGVDLTKGERSLKASRKAGRRAENPITSGTSPKGYRAIGGMSRERALAENQPKPTPKAAGKVATTRGEGIVRSTSKRSPAKGATESPKPATKATAAPSTTKAAKDVAVPKGQAARFGKDLIRKRSEGIGADEPGKPISLHHKVVTGPKAVVRAVGSKNEPDGPRNQPIIDPQDKRTVEMAKARTPSSRKYAAQ